jgi:hypothetical protein
LAGDRTPHGHGSDTSVTQSIMPLSARDCIASKSSNDQTTICERLR